MKPTLRKSFPQPEYSFVVRKDTGRNIRTDWHYHPDYEIVHIQESRGTWLVGDYVGPFKTGDVILMGPGLPHSYRHDPEFITEPYRNTPGVVNAILFLKEVMGADFLNMHEMTGIRNILALAGRGIKLTGKTRQVAGKIMKETLQATPGRRLVNLLDILQVITDENEYEVLASNKFIYESNRLDDARIGTIVEYTFNNFQNRITIEEIASLINMSKYSFCHFFKDKTKKTFIQFLMEVRIGKACRLLIEEDMNIAEVCYACGYKSISHFNHQFKAIKNKSPLTYKQDFNKLLSTV